MPKQHPAQTAAGLVRRWEDCLAPHELPKWAEDAALTMRALLALPAPSAEEAGGNGLRAAVSEAYAALFGNSTMVTTNKVTAASHLANGSEFLVIQFNTREEATRAHAALRVLEDAATSAPGAAAAAPSQAQRATPALYVSPEQLAAHTDHVGEHARYLPARKTPSGKFTQPLYAVPPSGGAG